MTAASFCLAGLPGLIGDELGPTRPRALTKAEIDAFADITGDRQSVHVDPARARPHGATSLVLFIHPEA